MEKGGAIYILSNSHNTVLYTGVTNDLVRRIYEHRIVFNSRSFSAKYNVTKVVYFESFHSIEEAILREKQIKGGSRKKKVDLINSKNPEWEDLWEEIQNW